jgi:hypothetical protein
MSENPWTAIASELGYRFERDLHPQWRRLTSHPDGASFWVNLDHVVRIALVQAAVLLDAVIDTDSEPLREAAEHAKVAVKRLNGVLQ